MKKIKFKFSLKTGIFFIAFPIALFTALIVVFTSVRSSKLKNQTDIGCNAQSSLKSGFFQTGETTAFFQNLPFQPPEQELINPPANIANKAFYDKNVLGIESSSKWIEVDLANQKTRAWEGDKLIYEFPVSTGKWARTPTGEFRIWIKVKYTKMEGGRKEIGTYYYLPNVPYVMYFYKGYGFHGTYWHNNFGRPMSHGCINLSIPDSEKLFYWADPVISPSQYSQYPNKNNPGTRVVIHGTAPWE